MRYGLSLRVPSASEGAAISSTDKIASPPALLAMTLQGIIMSTLIPMQKILQNILAALSKKVLQKYKPTIVGITGSVGKTSAKEAIFAVISDTFFSRKPEKNYNNEFGLPLTILGSESGGKNPFAWLWILTKACVLVIFPVSYPQVLILEMGVDKPGDMAHLLAIAKPNIGVITAVGISHYEFFKTAEAVAEEKGKLAQALTASDTLIVNADDAGALAQTRKTTAKIFSYGLTSGNVCLSNIKQIFSAATAKTDFLATTPKGQFEASIQAVGQTHLSAAASAIAIAEVLGMPAAEIVEGLKNYRAFPGRLNVLAGIQNTILIDDTYNSAPDSVKVALGLLTSLTPQVKIAILGDMLELGNLAQQEHLAIGRLIAQAKLKILVTIGPLAKIIAAGAINAGMPKEAIVSFDNTADALPKIQNVIIAGAAVLIKGSQGIRMEKITQVLLQNPASAPTVLCRQYGKWLKK